MHKEEGIIDEADLGVALETYLCHTACLHHYHLFFLEIHHTNPFSTCSQGHRKPSDSQQGLVCRKL